MKDSLGILIQTHSPEALAQLNLVQGYILDFDYRIETIPEIADQHPTSVLLQCYAAIKYLSRFTQRDIALAKTYLKRGREHADEAGLRGKTLLTALEYWAQSDFINASNTLKNLVTDWPSDLIALRTYEDILHYRSKSNFLEEYQALLKLVKKTNQDSSVYYNLLAHSALLANQKSKALKYAEQSLALNPQNYNVLNIQAAATWAKGDHHTAIKVLHQAKPHFAKLASIVQTRNLCLEACIYLDAKQYQHALNIVQTMVKQANAYSIDEIMYLVCIMWQLDIIGENNAPDITTTLNQTWTDLGPHLFKFRFECLLPTFNALLCYAYSRSGDYEAAEENLKAISMHVHTTHDPDQKQVWQKFGFNIVGAAIAYAEQEYLAAVKLFDTGQAHWTQIGGDAFLRTPFHLSSEDALAKATRRGEDLEGFFYHWSSDFRAA